MITMTTIDYKMIKMEKQTDKLMKIKYHITLIILNATVPSGENNCALSLLLTRLLVNIITYNLKTYIGRYLKYGYGEQRLNINSLLVIAYNYIIRVFQFKRKTILIKTQYVHGRFMLLVFITFITGRYT